MVSKVNSVELPNGLRFTCRVDGRKGGAWVVLSNSHCTNLSLWDELVAALEDRYRILRYDQRGHGGTTAAEPPYTMDELVEDVVGLLDHFGIARSHFVGVSMGGATGLGLALDHPDRLVSAVLCDSSTGGGVGSSDWDDRIAVVHREGLGALVGPTIARWFAPASVAAATPAVARVGEMIRTTTAAGYIGCANALQTYDYRGRLEEVTVPCLLVAGEKDGTRPQTMRAIHQRMPGSRFAVIEDAGHLPNVERPAEFNRVVRGFLDGFATGA